MINVHANCILSCFSRYKVPIISCCFLIITVYTVHPRDYNKLLRIKLSQYTEKMKICSHYEYISKLNIYPFVSVVHSYF